MKSTSTAIDYAAICGATSLGERGQVVIPKEARQRLKMKPGDRFLVINHHHMLILAPEKIMQKMIKKITETLK